MSMRRTPSRGADALDALREDDGTWEVVRFDAATEDGWRGLLDALRNGAYQRFVDAVTEPLEELLRVRDPARTLGPDELARAASELTGGAPLSRYGSYCLYPWSGVVAHVLPEHEFHALRTSRNRHKILEAEQERLRRARIGVVGLSVGHAIAVTMALEGVGGAFRLADFDALSVSNMNRVPAGLEGMGVNKAVLAARRLLEIDPYLSVEVFDAGVTETNAAHFFGAPGEMDLLVEECDDLAMKVRLRERARALGIPVVCETNDRGLLDVERFDREPERPLLHGLLGELRSETLAGLPTREKVPFVLRFLGGAAAISPRMGASLVEIDRTLAGWSQLGSGTTLGGAVVTDAARRLLLGRLEQSGRFRVDLERLIADGASALSAGPASSAAPPTPTPTPPAARPATSRGGVSHEVVRHLVTQAARAPSGGNAQPWRFVWRRDGGLDVRLDRSRAGTLLDFRLGASQVACGAAALNAELAADALGLASELVVLPDPTDPDLVASLLLPPGRPLRRASTLASWIDRRATNRKRGQPVPLVGEHRAALEAAAAHAGATLTLLGDAARMGRVAEVMGELDRLRFFSPRLHREMMAEVRWSPEEAARTGDGIEVASLEGDATDRAAMELLAHRPTVDELASLGGGRAIAELAGDAVAGSSALGLITWPSPGPEAYVRGGMAMQRVWLTATSLGLALQPMSIATFLFARLERGQGEGFSDAEVRWLRALRFRFGQVFPTPSTHTEVLLFRLASAEPPSVRSHRLPLEKVFEVS